MLSTPAYDEGMRNNGLKNRQKSKQQESLFIVSQKKSKHSSTILLFVHAGKTIIHCQKKKNKEKRKIQEQKKPMLMHKCSFPDICKYNEMMSRIN